MDREFQRQISMLRILHATCSTAVDAFHAADNPVDAKLLADLEEMVERTRVELERLIGQHPETAPG
jgi:hypothetical protein